MKKRQVFNLSFFMPVAGVEPARCRQQRILSPPRLPIPTYRLAYCLLYHSLGEIAIAHEKKLSAVRNFSETGREQREKKTARAIVRTVFLLASGIGIRTPTYRVRVCCATFTQYRYQLFFSERFVSLSLTSYIISDSFLFVNTFLKKT